jgi:hypothetical protein
MGLRKMQASTFSFHKMPRPHFNKGTTQQQTIYNVTVAMFNEDRHAAKVKKHSHFCL